LSQSTRVTNGRTDGQTDRILLAKPRLHYMHRGKNETRTPEFLPVFPLSRQK